MRIDIRHKNLEMGGRLRDALRRRLEGRLGRFSAEVATALLRLEDLNGPRGGVDKGVLVEVAGPRLGRVVVEARGASTVAVVNEALRRLLHAIRRAVGRARSVGSRRSTVWGS